MNHRLWYCYLKQLLIHFWMILMYHNKNVTSPIQHNKYEHHTNISTQHNRVIICTMLLWPCHYFGMSAEYTPYTVPRDVSNGAMTRILNLQNQEGKQWTTPSKKWKKKQKNWRKGKKKVAKVRSKTFKKKKTRSPGVLCRAVTYVSVF